jgi:hypothetical protein
LMLAYTVAIVKYRCLLLVDTSYKQRSGAVI